MQNQTPVERTTPGRQRLVWQLLADAVASVTPPERPAVVLDCGGGSGSFAVPLAQAGALVTVVDVSVDALATLRRRAGEVGVADRVVPVQADVESLADAVAHGSFDLVLAHGILEAVDQVAPAFDAIAATVRPGGLLSVLVTNPVAGVLARALAGDVAAALRELRGLDTDFSRPGPPAVLALCRGAGLLIEQVHGIGVFAELVPGTALDAPGALEAVADLEAETAARPPFCDIASRVHILARRP
ncbi:MAG: SAM-dependent methyltransferase [Pseudonocardiales bacterium]|nr:MAG: SAM-dependent methyltransferase [Pseudonocardiales bacterium]